MWLLIYLCAFVSAIAYVCASAGDEATVFRKCCPKNQSLVQVSQISFDIDGRYDCIDGEGAFVVADNVEVDHNMPEKCDKIRMSLFTDSEITSADDVCYDRLVSEIVNGTTIQNIPKTVSLTCIHNETENSLSSKLQINHIRKCCPKGKAFDREYHSCRDIDEESSDEWFLRLFNISHSYIFEVDNGLHCKSNAYTVELSEDIFSMEVVGNILHYMDNKNKSGRVAPGEWCIDREFSGSGLVARVCTQNCSAFGAFCLRKCCPVGEHYKPFSCRSLRSYCVSNGVDDEVLFDMSSYLNPLRNGDDDVLFDVMGIRENLKCENGKYALNRSSAGDRHWMTRAGLLLGSTSVDSHNYCLEAFDMRKCPSADIIVTGLSCFVKLEEKNFTVAAVINMISAVCLSLTLIVYCALPELRNLHGRTIISHVSMMCLAYSCLARAQYGKIDGVRTCTIIGYGIYFGFMAAFVWLNVMCFDIWWTFGSIRTVQPFRKAGTERRRFIWYSVYAWGMALAITIAVLLLDIYPVANVLDANMGKDVCWFGSQQNTASDWPHYIFFVIPMGLMTFINLVLWLLTARHCARVKSEVHRLQAGSVGDRAKRRFRIDRSNYVLTGKLWVVMGAGWFSELLSTLIQEPAWLWTVIDLINQLQGVFIFLILVFKPKIYHLIKKRLGLEKPDAQKNGNTSSGARTSSTFLSRTISTDERANMRTSLPNNGVKRA